LVRPDDAVTAVSMDTGAAVNAAFAHNPEIESAVQQLEKTRAAVRAGPAEYIPEVARLRGISIRTARLFSGAIMAPSVCT
jgi:hypothetical protein